MLSFASSFFSQSPSSLTAEQVLSAFSKELSIPIKTPGDSAKVMRVMRMVLDESSIASMRPHLERDLTDKVVVLQSLMASTRPFAISVLKDKMKEMVEGKIKELESMTAKEQKQMFCQQILTGISPDRMASFIDTTEGFYCKALLDEKSSKEALTFALGKGFVRAMVNFPSDDEIGDNLDKINKDLDFENSYTDPVTLTFVGSDAMTFTDKGEISCKRRYHPSTINDLPFIIEGGRKYIKDPFRSGYREAVPDYKAGEIVKNKLFSLLYPELVPPSIEPELAVFMEIEALNDMSFLQNLSVTYPLIKKEYEDLSTQSQDSHSVISAVEALARKAIDQFAFPAERVSLQDDLKAWRTIKEEAEIRRTFPKCLLGAEEWATHLGEVKKEPLPEGILSVLNQPCPITTGKRVGETHMLVLIPSEVSGDPLTLNGLGRLLKDKRKFPLSKAGYNYICHSIVAEHGNNPAGPSHYVLMTKDVLPESRNKNCKEQNAMVAALVEASGITYETPHLLTATVCMLMHQLVSKAQLFNSRVSTVTRCQEQAIGAPTLAEDPTIPKWYPTLVGFFSERGLHISNGDGRSDSCGIAALRKFCDTQPCPAA